MTPCNAGPEGRCGKEAVRFCRGRYTRSLWACCLEHNTILEGDEEISEDEYVVAQIMES